MKVKFLLFLVATLFIGYTTEAQTRVSKRVSQTIYFQSQPAGAHVYYDGRLICTTPGMAKINKTIYMPVGKKKDDLMNIQRAINSSTITFQFIKNGYQIGEETIAPEINFDRRTNYLSAEYPKEVVHHFQEDPNLYEQDNTIRAGEAKKAVNRDEPGSTALERTIIRWYFESQPQGARIFWRVISSCPDQVKNTNELWLGNTPFEETRSFNIQGLTYENSRDVQIEIKVRRAGYLDQTKRFNVRQAIDQQEISSFFDMIKAEEE